MKKNKPSTHLNAALIMQRLPFHQQLSLSQAALIKCTPVWQNWAKHNLVSETTKAITLSHFENGELTLHCANAISATQVNQQQQTLLKFFNDKGITEINKITVRITNSFAQKKNASYNNLDMRLNASNASNQTINKLDKNSLNSIKSIQKGITNDELAESLNRLIQTIEKNK